MDKDEFYKILSIGNDQVARVHLEQMEKLDKLQIAEIASWCILHDIGHDVCVPEDGHRCIYVRPGNKGHDGYNLVIDVTAGNYAQVIDGIIGDNIYDWPDGKWQNIPDIQRATYKKSK